MKIEMKMKWNVKQDKKINKNFAKNAINKLKKNHLSLFSAELGSDFADGISSPKTADDTLDCLQRIRNRAWLLRLFLSYHVL